MSDSPPKRVSLQKKGATVLEVRVDDMPYRDLHTTIFGKRPSLPDHPDLLDKALERLEYKGAKRWVYKALSCRSYPSALLRQKLRERFVSTQTIDQVLEGASSYLDDELWITKFVQQELQRGKGPRFIQAKLQQKGIEYSAIEQALAEVDEAAEKDSLKAFCDKHQGLERHKLFQRLQRRGFSTQAILEYFS